MSFHVYWLKFTQLSRHVPKMVKDISCRMHLFFAGLGRASSKEGRAATFTGDMDICRFTVYV